MAVAKLSSPRHVRPRCDGSLTRAVSDFDGIRGLCAVCRRPQLVYSSSVHGPDLVVEHAEPREDKNAAR